MHASSDTPGPARAGAKPHQRRLAGYGVCMYVLTRAVLRSGPCQPPAPRVCNLLLSYSAVAGHRSVLTPPFPPPALPAATPVRLAPAVRPAMCRTTFIPAVRQFVDYLASETASIEVSGVRVLLARGFYDAFVDNVDEYIQTVGAATFDTYIYF